MSQNPLALTWFLANTALVGVILAFAIAVPLGFADQPLWVWAIGGIAVAGAVAQFVVSVLFPGSIRPAWDEQAVSSHRAAHGFGYWAALVCFLGLFVATQAEWLSASTAFFWMAPVLAAAPSLYMAIAALRGRAG